MLRLKQISKSFPGVQALSQVDFEVEAGEIHALVGENGAGKSTLTKIIAGAYQPDAGHIELDGAAVRWDSPGDAKRRGIHVIYQELILFPELSVAENIFIGNERRRASGAIDYRRTLAEASDILKELGAGLDPRLRVGELSVANQQMVEIARALVQNVRLLVLDEPTAVISSREVEQLFKRLRALAQRRGRDRLYLAPPGRGVRAFRPRHRPQGRRTDRHAGDRRHDTRPPDFHDGRPRSRPSVPAEEAGQTGSSDRAARQ